MRQPLKQELAAVCSLAARLGLRDAEPIVLKLAKHTTLRLGQFVARVQSAGDLAAARAMMTREVAVAQHLARCDAPTVRPAAEVAPGPYEADGSLISLWSFVDHRAAEEADAAAVGAALKRFHATLASYDGALPAYMEAVAECAALAEDAAAMAATAPDDRAFLARLVRSELEQLPSDPKSWIALHGDAHLGNVMMTPTGAVWADLEAVCRGPLEWDLCNKPAAFLASFEGVDVALLDQLGSLRRACVAVWCWADAARSAETRAAAEFHTMWLRRAATRFA
jgi:aminoglycoside phosphotransferase (APT) family kinase protein